MSICVPALVDAPGTSRHLPLFGLYNESSERHCHCCAALLLHGQNCTLLPLAVRPPEMSKHTELVVAAKCTVWDACRRSR